jgi:formate dehydrogenase subunit gamma
VWSEERLRQIVAEHRHRRGPLVEILHAVQAEFDHVDASAVPILADELNLSRAEVHGVVTFYRDFTDRPPTGPVVRVCRAEACQARGGRLLAEHAHTRAASAGLDLRDVFCLGNCALGPSVEIDGRLHGRVDAARFDVLVAPSTEPAGS